jgi:hypothetical protein
MLLVLLSPSYLSSYPSYLSSYPSSNYYNSMYYVIVNNYFSKLIRSQYGYPNGYTASYSPSSYYNYNAQYIIHLLVYLTLLSFTILPFSFNIIDLLLSIFLLSSSKLLLSSYRLLALVYLTILSSSMSYFYHFHSPLIITMHNSI